MRASDCPTVDTTEFLLAALEQASEAVVIIDSDLHVTSFQRGGGIDLGRRPRGYPWPRCKLSRAYRPAAELRDHDPARRWQPASGIRIGLARRDRRPKQLHGLCSRHHRRGRTARADRASEPGGRQDHPRRRRHRSQPARRLYQRGVLRHVRILGRGSAGTASQPVARRTVDRPQDPARGCAAGSATDAATGRKSSPTTRTATRSGSRPRSRRSATIAGASNTYSPC